MLFLRHKSGVLFEFVKEIIPQFSTEKFVELYNFKSEKSEFFLSNTYRKYFSPDSPKIVSANISKQPRPMPEGMFDPMPEVSVTTETGESLTLFTYYPDEISFTPDEFKGLTVEQAVQLKSKKDLKFLSS